MLNRRFAYSVRPEDLAADPTQCRGDYPIQLLTKRDFGLGATEIIETRSSLPRQLGFGRNVRRAHVSPG